MSLRQRVNATSDSLELYAAFMGWEQVPSSELEEFMDRHFYAMLSSALRGLPGEVTLQVFKQARDLLSEAHRAMDKEVIKATILRYENWGQVIEREEEWILSRLDKARQKIRTMPGFGGPGTGGPLAWAAAVDLGLMDLGKDMGAADLGKDMGSSMLPGELAASGGEADILTWALAAAFLLALLLALYVVFRLARASSSEEYIQFTRAYSGQEWAKKLLSEGERKSWNLKKAWSWARLRLRLNEEEKAAAVETLAGRAGIEAVTREQGDVEQEPRTGAPGRYVLRTLRPGLRVDGKELEPALVEPCTADYLALVRTGEELGTRTYREQPKAEVDRECHLDEGILRDTARDLGDSAVIDGWLAELERHCPGRELERIVPTAGDAFNEHSMSTASQLVSKHGATVSAPIHHGLRQRCLDKVLLKAKVDAVDSVTGMFDDEGEE